MENKKSSVPKLRFPGFTGAWEQRKLGEVAHIETGKLDANAMVENGKYDFYTSGIKKYRIDIPAFKGPAITIAGNGATVGYMHLADGEFNAYQRTYVLTKFLANRHFIFSEIGNKLPRKIQQESRAGNIPYIVMDMLTDLQLFLPSIAEQEKVGELLNKLNSLITLHQRKLEHLKEQKKGLLQKMFPKNGETVPEVRFPGFTDAWEQRKLGGVFSILKNNTLSRANLSDEHGAAQDIHYGDILTKFNETLDISTTAVPYIQNEEVIEKTKATLLKNGDIVLADTAEDEIAGKCTEIVGLVNQKVFAGLHTIPLRPNQSFSKGFLGFYMNSIAFRDQLKSLMQGIKVLSISKKALKETVISFPHDLREQEKIGQHLSNIDTLIALHQRKLEHLELMKKGLLQQMFV